LPDSSLEVEVFVTGSDPPRYAQQDVLLLASVGFVFRDLQARGELVYAPALGELDDRLEGLLGRADCVLVDGTFWQEDELVVLGGKRKAREMGHTPLGGRDGSLARFARLGARTVLVHVNNTNPILLEESRERMLVAERGLEVAYDGMEIELP
jgi:pyrroloquinoline quinone biosynthesis protein B